LALEAARRQSLSQKSDEAEPRRSVSTTSSWQRCACRPGRGGITMGAPSWASS